VVAARPLIAISRCLLGEAVRYDGRSKAAPELVEAIAAHCDIVPVCPELEAGLGVPRPPIALHQLPSGATAVHGRDDPLLDLTGSLQQQCDRFIRQHPHLDAALLQNRSPSCGVGDTPLLSSGAEPPTETDGYFCAALRAAYRDILITSPAALQNATALDQLLEQLSPGRKTVIISSYSEKIAKPSL
jgi:uncharacterized protein YbbK (DUF523 family)